ncbi:MAG: cytochrome [Phenylobacterium sp.]|nr:cytochrome [Phenylobacterium sp.]
MRKWSRRGAVAVTLFAVSAAAWAQAAEEMTKVEIVKNRQQRYREIGTAFKSINDELKKDSPVKFLLTSSSGQIVSAAREQPAMFPPGTGPGAGVKTRARVAIWPRRKEFDAANALLIVEAGQLNTLARAGDYAGMRAQAKVVGEACAACHRQFREEE